jgi:catechol 2,3-dioxygenase-like lactoylglutathione lyase family enzyme
MIERDGQTVAAPAFEGIHHLKIAVSDLERSTDFYRRVLRAERVAALDHVDRTGRLFAVILKIPNLGTFLELRHDSALAARHAGFDPMTLTVAGKAELEVWGTFLQGQGVAHSPVLTGAVGWLVVFEDPDGLRLRLYTRETHGPEEPQSQNDRWL